MGWAAYWMWRAKTMGGINNGEINRQCDFLAIELSLPVAWVRHHVDAKAGKPCPKCGGSGRWQGGYSHLHTGTCFRCRGAGGKATPAAVKSALQWVQDNAAKVKKLGTKRDAKRAQKAQEKDALKQAQTQAQAQRDATRGEDWAKENPRHAWALENMDDGEFKDSLVQAVSRGWMTDGRMRALWNKADELELRMRGDTKPAPEKDTKGSFKVRVTTVDYDFVNGFGEICVRVDFKAVDGWKGRLESRSTKVEAFMKGRTSDEVLVTGKVRWNKGDYAIIGGRVAVSAR